jgi:outer membrane protein OmpA-like peptidoglycan-associated protein
MGTVYINATQKIIPNAIVFLKNKNETIADVYKTTENAKYEFRVKCNKTYKIEGTKVNYKTSRGFLKTNGQNSTIARKNIFLTSAIEKAAPRRRLRTGKVDFNYNESKLLKRYTYELDKAIILMKEKPELLFEFESHTDCRADDEFNMNLTRERVEKITEYMGFKGISIVRIKATAYGETKPLNGCVNGVDCFEEEYLINRRTTFVLKERKKKKE